MGEKKKGETVLIKRFEDSLVWQEARKLMNAVYDMTDAKVFRKDCSLSDQLRRASVSCMSNVAEGFDSHTKQQFIQMLNYTRRSASEVQSGLYAALDRKYINEVDFKKNYEQAASVRRLANGFIRHLRGSNKQSNSHTRGAAII